MATTVPVTMDTLVTIKVSIQGSNRKFKVPMRDLGAAVLPTKLRQLLNIPPNQQVIFERFSDSAGAYIILDPDNPQVYKTLFRAAKAKLKLRLRATVTNDPSDKTERSAIRPTPLPVELPTRNMPALVSRAESIRIKEQSRSSPAPQQQNNTGTIPLYPYARLPAFHKTDMKTSLPSSASATENNGEAQVPQPFDALPCGSNTVHFLNQNDGSSVTTSTWSVYCNQCDGPIVNEHFHCSICDEGDFDLCKACVDAGEHCHASVHWLVKRFIQNGKVSNSTTERIGPKSKPEDFKMEFEAKTEPASEENKGMPGAYFGDAIDKATFGEAKPQVEIPLTPTRTCNSCVKELPDPNFVHCTECDDYDLCLSCHVGTQHGHHPGHSFEPVTEGPLVGPLAKFLCAAGRNVRHSAVCDGCEEFIFGVRHKCLNCPDWDYCGKCVKNANTTHPTHRFVPIYEPLPEPRTYAVRHFGIYCDGPLCKNKDQTYIEGVRYKCAVCDDLDFCAGCEAAPGNRHNRTHPLIKFKTPVRKVHVTTAGEDKWGKPMLNLGDAPLNRPDSADRQRPASNNASTQIRTVVDLKPTAEAQTSEDAASKAATDKIKIKDLLTEPLDRRSKLVDALKNTSLAARLPIRAQNEPADVLNAHFIRDTICDGTSLPANCKFLQVWTLRNPGPRAWPAGCSVRYVGGDNMLNVDNETSSNAFNIVEAVESNVINNPVEAGQEVSFGVLMKAPAREGVAISYWRVKAPDGTPFGHRLWCHINVLKASPLPVESPMSADSERTLLRLKELRERRQTSEMSDSDRNSRRRELIRRSTQMIRERRLEREAAERLESEMTAGAVAPLEAKRKSLKPTVEDAPESETSDSPVKEEPKETKAVEAKDSRMVFPTLEKESPESSNHEAANQSAKSDKSTVAASEPETEIFEDAETVDISSDDGFLTDEEYDVLDASDEEFV
ncbi:hypothetical protein IWX50DRAFT_670688 [Phyllosticta citricarpa]|uniref:ZZ-type domain-containing protein n=1 Tax=Phyllosticta citricarpa TaxID=55181 RepID=A0ABR1MJF0_9PEZI